MWDAYVQRSRTATMCHKFVWQPIISRTYGHQPFYLMARSETLACGILPLFLVKSRLFGKSLTSMPFLDYGGVCADDEMTARLLLEQAFRLMEEVGQKGRVNVSAAKVTFDKKSRSELESTMREAATELSRYSSFLGFAIHSYESYRPWLKRASD